jgi:hypothetical protein
MEDVMGRETRAAYAPAFGEGANFNDELYDALRQSPWWMISIGVHVLLVLVSSMFATESAAVPKAQVVSVTNPAAPTDVPEPEPPVDPGETETPYEDPLFVEEPVLTNAPVEDKNRTDNDVDDDSARGTEEGTSHAQFDGPSSNPHIGIGGGPGSPKGNGFGSNRYSRPPSGKRGTPQRDAVEHALRWLAAHQSPDGGWEAEGFPRWCDGKPAAGSGPDGKGKAQYDVGVSGLALLAFLGAGYTHRDEGPFGKVVQSGLRYLKSVQDAEGCFGHRSSGHFVYNHAIAALAMVEAYGMTGAAIYRGSAQKGLDFIALSRNSYNAWRYGVKPGENDTSVTGWMMMALKSAKLVNAAEVLAGRAPPLQLDEDAFDGIRSWIERMTDPETGRVGYTTRGSGPARLPDMVDRFPEGKSESMTAVGMLARVFLGENPKGSDPITKGAQLCVKALPTWNPNDGSIDMYYWYYGTLAMFQVGGDPWKKWDAAMKTAIVDTQRLDGDYCMYKGSWDPLDPWKDDGGRVYSTAALAMCLEIYYRYPMVVGTK